MRRGTATWSQDSGTTPQSAKQRPGMILNYWSNRRIGTATWSQDSGTSLLSAKQRPGIQLDYWSNRRRGMETWSQDTETSQLSAKQRPGMRPITGWIWGEVLLPEVRNQEHLRCHPSRDQVWYSITGRIGGNLESGFINVSTVSQAATRYATQLLVE